MIVIKNGRKVIGTGTIVVPSHRVTLYVNSNGTNAATAVFRVGSSTGALLFEMASTKSIVIGPIDVQDTDTVYYSVTGTGAFAVVYDALK